MENLTIETEGMPTVPAPRDSSGLGTNLDGTPKRDGRGRPRKTAAPKVASPKPPRARPSSKKKTPDVAEWVTQILSIPAAGLMAAGQVRDSVELVADGVVLTQAAPAIGKAVASLAEHDSRISAWLEKAMQASPYAELIVALVPLGIQLAANHRAVPVGIMGAREPEAVVTEFFGGAPGATDVA